MRLVPLAPLLAVLAAAPVSARTLAGVDMPDTVVVDGTTLRLNGMGLRQAFRVKAYVGGLYLQTPSRDATTVIDSRQPKRVTMQFLRDIGRGMLTSDWADELRGVGGARLDPSITQFTSLIPDVRKGDRLTLTWRPGVGVEIALNDQVRGSVPGDEFGRALFTVWFGPKPGDENLKRGMLGA